jgi:uncharacterized membrane protein YedE/YeeE
MRARVAGLAVGLIFGVTLAWSGLSSPVVIREALLFEHAYLYFLFASAVLVAAIGIALLPDKGTREPPGRRHIVGAAVFGLGWGIADACPGPIANQVGQGIAWGLFTFAGVVIGVYLFLRQRQPETEPATDAPATRDVGMRATPRVAEQ